MNNIRVSVVNSDKLLTLMDKLGKGSPTQAITHIIDYLDTLEDSQIEDIKSYEYKHE